MLKEQGRGNFAITHVGVEQIPPEVIVDGAIMDSTVVAEAIRRLLATQKIKNKKVILSVSGHSVIVKKISLPQMSREELQESIQWEAEQYIPFDIEDVNIDFHLLQSEEASISSEMEVILVAVKKDKINDFVGVVRQAGLSPVIVDVDGFALFNQYEFNFGTEPGSKALIDIGAAVMNINILQDGIHMLYRDISIGGNQYTEAIQKELKVSFDQAEGLKMGEEVKGIHPEDVAAIIDSVSEDVCLEIQRSFDYFTAMATNATIDRIFITGGGAKLNGLDKFMQNKLGAEVVHLNPFQRIQFNPKKFDPVYMEDIAPVCAIVTGLALRRD